MVENSTERDFRFLAPIALQFDKTDPESFVKSLRSQMREGLKQQGIENRINRAVYVIRMTGSFLIAYNAGNSPVLYIGRGNARGRVIGHIGQWIRNVSEFGNDTQVEVRILIPRRQRRPDFYKNVEADLLHRFAIKYSSLPYFNGRTERRFAEQVNYSAAQEKRLTTLISIGSGRRPWWALKPTKANPTRQRYLQGGST